MRRRILAGGLLLLAAPAEGEDDPIRLSLQVEAPPGGPLVQEMVRLTLRAVFRDQPNQVVTVQPDFADARWMALGEDAWSHVSFGGPARVMVQRRLAWFPQRSGRLGIGPFRLDAMVLDRTLARVPAGRATAPVAIDVRPAPADAGEFWLPARALRLTDAFSEPPGRLGLDQVARRTVVIEAEGVEAPQVPPLPPLHVPGVIAFAQPVRTQTVVRSDGPLVRVAYAWDIRPVNANPALLPEIRISWFDTATRGMREAVLPPVQVSLAAVVAAAALPPQPARPPADVGGMVAAGSAAFILASGALWAPWSRLPGLARRLRLAVAVAWAARRGDAPTLRRLLANEPGFGAVVATLDHQLFAARPPQEPVPRGLFRRVLRHRPASS